MKFEKLKISMQVLFLRKWAKFNSENVNRLILSKVQEFWSLWNFASRKNQFCPVERKNYHKEIAGMVVHIKLFALTSAWKIALREKVHDSLVSLDESYGRMNSATMKNLIRARKKKERKKNSKWLRQFDRYRRELFREPRTSGAVYQQVSYVVRGRIIHYRTIQNRNRKTIHKPRSTIATIIPEICPRLSQIKDSSKLTI